MRINRRINKLINKYIELNYVHLINFIQDNYTSPACYAMFIAEPYFKMLTMLFTLYKSGLCKYSLRSSRVFYQANTGQPGVLKQPFELVYLLNREREKVMQKIIKRIGPKYVSIARMWYIHTV